MEKKNLGIKNLDFKKVDKFKEFCYFESKITKNDGRSKSDKL